MQTQINTASKIDGGAEITPEMVEAGAGAILAEPGVAEADRSALEIPREALSRSFRVLCPGGFEPPSWDDHTEAARELILALLDCGWAIFPPAFCIPRPSNKTNPEHIRNIDFDVEGGRVSKE
jgi:hypothetical protein